MLALEEVSRGRIAPPAAIPPAQQGILQRLYGYFF
jgi:hypothetical protein